MKSTDDTAGRPFDLSMMVDMDNPESVYREVGEIASMTFGGYDSTRLRKAFDDTVRLYAGEYPGYSGCNTQYHDLRHCTDVFLAMARLMHGMYLKGFRFDESLITLGLISALMHDTGYIQSEGDNDGTGAKYTATHVQRSIEFMREYFDQNGFSKDEFEICKAFVEATSLDTKLKDISFSLEESRVVGNMLFAADLLGQMADRLYLEKLLFLFREFSEASIMAYQDELDLLKKTLGFFEMMRERLENDAGYSSDYMRVHFKERWDIDRDLYLESLSKNILYLKYVLDNYGGNYREMLNRGGIVGKLNELDKPSLT